MTDPVSAGGASAIRYAVSTVPALITMPVGLCIPVGRWLGSVEGGMTTGFTASILLAMVAELIRRGTVARTSPATRRSLLGLLTLIYYLTPVLAGLGLVLGIVAVSRCFGPACSTEDHVFAVIGLIFAAIAVLTSVVLITFLHSPVWARHRAASAAGQS